ncbi:succinylglutamate desuccinylase/aspartoacylase family protein [Acidisoma silvae]|uniref:Succinylglutamate desuccinylase/aspartoacylase family protein n=1 Tax=Acidisoma silvae TaxID=2802396 RepID=A0A963YW27_9PROT|nr:succinylglutamate desuccinylase/aspartoacylase family protein [Acidisoma silvae]MCB8878194.1 succinylglutamate desuccinylase/aspartoacylase family protein [Acidisoma silvae]
MSDWRFALVSPPAPGVRAQGFLSFDDPVLTGRDWPYVAIRGAAPGPAVLITAGIHGSEYPAIDAAVRLGALLNPQSMHGQVLVLPLMNPGAFWQRAAYVVPEDGQNLNRVFPGKADGSFSERLAWQLVQKAIRHADAYIDMHGGDMPEALVPFSIYQESGDAAVDAKSDALARAFGSPSLLIQRRRTDSLSGMTIGAAADFGVPGIIAEDGGAGLYDAAIAKTMLAGAENVLRSLGVLADATATFISPDRYAGFLWPRSRHAGFFRPSVCVGDSVAVGDTIGILKDFFDQTTETIIAEASGRILFLVTSPAIAENGLICGIGLPAA